MTCDDAFTVLATPPPKLSDEHAATVLRGRYGIEGTLKPLASERDQNFLVEEASGRKRLLKISNSEEAPVVTEFQTAALMHLEAADPGTPVPRIISTLNGSTHTSVSGEDGRGHAVRLMSWLEGIPLDAVADKPDIAPRVGEALARLGLALDGFEHPGSDYALLWDLKHAENLGELLSSIRDDALHALCHQRLAKFTECVKPAMQNLRSQVIYNDLNPGNLLVDPGDPRSITGIIDFGDIVRSPLIVDVAVGAAYLCRSDRESLSDVVRFVAGFNRVRALQDAELDVLFDLMMTRHVMTILISRWRAVQFPRNRDYILCSEARARRTIENLVGMQPGEFRDMLAAARAD